MTNSQTRVAHWLRAARAGSPEALGHLLETCRNYLLRIANQGIDSGLKAKGGASDLVQQTFLEAQRDFTAFQGESDAELLAWLRQLLLHNLSNFRRRYRGTGMRQVGREIALGAGDSSTDRGEEIAGGAPSPLQQAMRHEEEEALRQALGQLPEKYRQVITWRHQEQYTFEEMGHLLNCTANGARTLFVRALDQLFRQLEAP